MQVTDSPQSVSRWKRDGVWPAAVLTAILSLVTIMSGQPAGWEPLFPLIFAVVLFLPVFAVPSRAGTAGVILMGLVAGIAGFASHLSAFIAGWLNTPPSEAGGNAMLSLLVVYTVSGVLFVGRAAVALLRDRPPTSAWSHLAPSTLCIATMQAAWIIRFW